MKVLRNILRAAACLGVAAAFVCPTPQANACTRVTYVGDNAVITGRTLDWKTPIPNNIYVLPRGIARQSYDEPERSVQWTSRYASVVAVGYDIGVAEGMNQEGLCCNILYLPGTYYAEQGDPRPLMSTSLWAQYVLDNFATTREAVATLSLDAFQINAPAMPGGDATTVHMAISDKTGNSAIVEYLNGKLSIHEGKQYQVLTNAPPYDQQLAIYDYWKTVGGLNMLPGTARSQDRFTRASFYVGMLDKDLPHDKALGGVFGIVGNCAVPTGISIPNQPEISTTQWRSVSDQTNQIYFYRETNSPSTIWIDLREFDIYPGAPIMKLDLISKGQGMMSGNVIKQMKKSAGYTPMFRAMPAEAAK